jgi:hypothetical protein
VQNECRRIFILDIQLEKDIIDNISTVHMNLNEFVRSYEGKIAQNANSSFKLQILIHLDDDLGNKSVVES